MKPSRSAVRYRPAPPTSTGTPPRAVIPAMHAAEIGAETLGAVGFVRVGEVDQVVGTDRLFGGRRLGRADAQAVVDLPAVEADDLQRQPPGQGRDQRGLAHGGGSHEGGADAARCAQTASPGPPG